MALLRPAAIRAAVAAALGLLVLLAGPWPASDAVAARTPVFGFGDQQPGMFEDARWRALGFRETRYMLPWDVFHHPDKLAHADRWMAAARAAGTRPLIAFDRSYSPRFDKRAPTPAQFRTIVRRVRARYPWVRQYTPWNEANYVSQPTARKPRLAADYWRILREECRGCTVTSPVILDWRGQRKSWITEFQKATRGRVRLWAIHVYGDMNRHRDGDMRRMLGRLRGDVWVTEVAGWVRFAERWRYDARRAAAVNRYIFATAWRHRARVSRWYLYQWAGTGPTSQWDSGLVNPDGSPRPALDVVRRALLSVRK